MALGSGIAGVTEPPVGTPGGRRVTVQPLPRLDAMNAYQAAGDHAQRVLALIVVGLLALELARGHDPLRALRRQAGVV